MTNATTAHIPTFMQKLNEIKPKNSVNVDYINGYLKAWANISQNTNENHTFELVKLPYFNSKSIVENLYSYEFFDKSWKLELEQINDWYTTLSSQLNARCLLNITFEKLSDGRRESLKYLLDYLQENVDAKSQFYQITIDPGKDFYECSWYDMLILSNSELYLLHLGVSD